MIEALCHEWKAAIRAWRFEVTEVERRPDTVRLQRISKAFWESAALMSAVELGVFTALAAGHNTIERAAQAMEIEAINAERLLVALTAMDLLERDGPVFSNTVDVERCLVDGLTRYAGTRMVVGEPRRVDLDLLEFLDEGLDGLLRPFLLQVRLEVSLPPPQQALHCFE